MSTESIDSIDIINAVDERRKRAETKALDVSLNELADMYESGELTIRPEYQRLFRWSPGKQSQFIESLILEMPVPPIFVIEDSQNKWELIDGLQRISSYLHFRGLLSAPELDPAIAPGDQLQLEECDIVTELNDISYDELPTALQIRLKRSFLRVEVVRHGTDKRFRYYMFKRLNTGGEILTDQEVRNCTIRLLGDEFNTFIIRLSEDESFRVCTESLTDDRRMKMGDVELVLRFFAFKNNFANFRHDVGAFMSDYMERVTDQESEDALEFHYPAEEEAFRKTFELLKTTLGENTCLSWTGQKYSGQFRMHHFEAFALGVARLLDDIDIANNQQIERIRTALIAVKEDIEFQQLTTGGGKNSQGPYKAKVDFVANRVRGVV